MLRDLDEQFPGSTEEALEPVRWRLSLLSLSLSLSLHLSSSLPLLEEKIGKWSVRPSVRPSASVCTHKREEGGREQSTAEERERERVVVSGHATKELTFYLRAQKGIGCSFL